MTRRFELHEHTADVAIEGRGVTMDDAFEAVAEGLAAAMCDRWPEEGESGAVTVVSESPEALLFDYLDELIYQRDVHNVLPVEHSVSIERTGDEWTLSGSYRGIPLDRIDAREIKAVTYSEMVLEPIEEGWRAYVVVDV